MAWTALLGLATQRLLPFPGSLLRSGSMTLGAGADTGFSGPPEPARTTVTTRGPAPSGTPALRGARVWPVPPRESGDSREDRTWGALTSSLYKLPLPGPTQRHSPGRAVTEQGPLSPEARGPPTPRQGRRQAGRAGEGELSPDLGPSPGGQPWAPLRPPSVSGHTASRPPCPCSDLSESSGVSTAGGRSCSRGSQAGLPRHSPGPAHSGLAGPQVCRRPCPRAQVPTRPGHNNPSSRD